MSSDKGAGGPAAASTGGGAADGDGVGEGRTGFTAALGCKMRGPTAAGNALTASRPNMAACTTRRRLGITAPANA